MSQLPEGLTAAPMTRGDLDVVLTLLQLVDMRTIGQIETSPADLHSWMSAPGIQLDRDATVVRNGPRVDGWVLVEHVGRDARLQVYSHPDWWEDGELDAWLLDDAIAKASALARREHVDGITLVTPEDDHRLDLMAKRGFEVVRRHRRLEVRFDRRSPDVPLPGGVDLRHPEGEADLRAVHRLLSTSFAAGLGREPVSWESWSNEHVEREDFDASLWWLAESSSPSAPDRLAGEPLGALVARDDQLAGSGWIAELATAPDARGRGIALAMLTAAFRAFHERGRGRVELGVDSDNQFGAQSLYERAGMRPTAVLLRLRRPVAPDETAPPPEQAAP